MIRALRRILARRRLAADVRRRRESYETRRFVERRAAALRGMGRA